MDAVKNAKVMESMLHSMAWAMMPAMLEKYHIHSMEDRMRYPVKQALDDEQTAVLAEMMFRPVTSISNEQEAKLFLCRLFFVEGMTIEHGFDPAKSFQGYTLPGGEWMFTPERASELSETLATGRLSVGLARLYEFTEQLMLEIHMIR